MKFARHLMAFIAVALMSVTASAATQQYHLTYKFNPLSSPSVWIPEPWIVQADFTGTRDGDRIRNLHFTSLTVANELLSKVSVDVLAGDFGGAVLSFSGKSNDFILNGYGAKADFQLFSYTMSPSATFVEGALYYFDDKHPPSGIWMSDHNVNSSWVISAVPEPASYAMLMLGLVALYVRKRSA